jgi:hypothetical protein
MFITLCSGGGGGGVWTLKLKKRKIIKSDGAIFSTPYVKNCYLLGK